MTAAGGRKTTTAEAERSRTGLFGRLGPGAYGPLPVLVGLAAIWTIFTVANPRFLSPVNLTNMMLQIAAVGTISVGIVLVLLLGEIDLSVGSVSGFAAGVMAVLSVKAGLPAILAILCGILVGLAIGAFNGFVVTRFGVHSLVVTLAGLLGFQGALLYVLGDTGTINLRDPIITGLAGTFFPPLVGWAAAAAVIAAYAAAVFSGRRRELAAGLERPLAPAVVRVVAVAAAVLAGVAVLNADRGLPLAVVIFLGFVVVFHLITKKTRFGRYLYAIGGNAEAARRAGIKVERVRVAAFTLCSALAAAGGILAASRLLAVNQSSGSGDILLNAIAGPVIAGTSLMGGRGSVWSALLGALVIGSISNGMDLLAFDSSIKFMVTGAVLLVAATIDAVASRRRRAT
ncbi:ABC transporter permease [Rubrobacter xylanophilus]|uniref:Xylose transport system permease protein XylH n=1 Tax=Rubrobacter xylanophilus TaxID=49319 RepID=A0A510HJV9_9ACTN|nr:sugar ABC transporter permease [Rubrobacter xylanophilus]BBL80290.1 ABC transporter permease [Rubrobacter xylanophilus]